jgi:hypothetical protein
MHSSTSGLLVVLLLALSASLAIGPILEPGGADSPARLAPQMGPGLEPNGAEWIPPLEIGPVVEPGG